MQLLVAGRRVEIEPWRSGYHLKSLLEREGRLTLNGKLIQDDVCLDQQGVRDGASLEFHEELKGGTSKITIFFWVAIVLYALLLGTLLMSGVFNLIAYLYGYLSQTTLQAVFTWMFEYKWVGMIVGSLVVVGLSIVASLLLGGSFLVGLLTGTALGFAVVMAFASNYQLCLRAPFRIAFNTIDFLIKHSIIFLFVYVAFTVVNYPVFGWRTQDHCLSIYTSKKLAVIGALVYVITYGLLNLPNFLAGVVMDLTNLTEPTETFLTPPVIATRDAIDFSKYIPTYFIPFIGPDIKYVHQIMSDIIASIYENTSNLNLFRGKVNLMLSRLVADTGANKMTDIQCQGRRPRMASGQLSSPQINALSQLTQLVKSNGLQKLVAYAWAGMDEGIYKCLASDYFSGSIFTKLGFTETGRRFITAYISLWMVESAMTSANDTQGYFNYIGNNVDVLIDTVKMGSISGIWTCLVTSILFIITLFWPNFLGYL